MFFSSLFGSSSCTNNPKSAEPPMKGISTWGNHKFQFDFRTHGKSLYQTSVLYADATSDGKQPIPIKCKWFRVRGDRTYQIEEIQTNVYQLNAEDIGCTIKVEATPCDFDEENLGVAFGQFGPVLLDPNARSTLEQVLGTGGSQYPVIVSLNNKSKGIEDSETLDAKLFISQQLIKVCFSNASSMGSSFGSDVLTLKYTIDYPRVEMHPFDTTRFLIYYDKSDSVDARYDFNHCIDLKALSRQSRDLIALSMKCFSAQTYLMNSKIISSLPQIPQSEQSLADLLIELEQVKKELGNQIKLASQYQTERDALAKQVESFEEEMQLTIRSYQEVLEEDQKSKQSNQSSAEQTVQILSKEKSELQANLLVLKSEIDQLRRQNQDSFQRNDQLLATTNEMKKQVGVPLSEHNKLKAKLQANEKQLLEIKEHGRANTDLKEKKFKQLQLSLEQLESQSKLLQQMLVQKEQENTELKLKCEDQKSNSFCETQNQNQVQLNLKVSELTEQNTQLVLQRKTLSKRVDSLQMELTQIVTKLAQIQGQHETCAENLMNVQSKFQKDLDDVELKSKMEQEKLIVQNGVIQKQLSRLEQELAKSIEKHNLELSKLERERKNRSPQPRENSANKKVIMNEISKLSQTTVGKSLKGVFQALMITDDQTTEEDRDKQTQTDLFDDVFNHLPADASKVLQLKQSYEIEQQSLHKKIIQLNEQINEKDQSIQSMEVELQKLAMRLCEAQEMIADLQ